MAFKERLKEAREAKGFTQQKLANLVGVSKSAIANYETGVSSAKEQVLIRLFDALDIEPNFLWQDEIAENAVNFACSLPEKEIIKKYRALDEHGKKIIDLVLEELNSRDEAEKSPLLQIDLYDLPASAGIGEPLEGEYRTLIEVPDTPLNRKADYCVRITGNSMEPTYKDGNIVLVKKGQVHIGDVGIFILDGESFIKELGEGKLISHNSKYSDLRLEDFNNIYIAGKVIGVI